MGSCCEKSEITSFDAPIIQNGPLAIAQVVQNASQAQKNEFEYPNLGQIRKTQLYPSISTVKDSVLKQNSKKSMIIENKVEGNQRSNNNLKVQNSKLINGKSILFENEIHNNMNDNKTYQEKWGDQVFAKLAKIKFQELKPASMLYPQLD